VYWVNNGDNYTKLFITHLFSSPAVPPPPPDGRRCRASSGLSSPWRWMPECGSTCRLMMGLSSARQLNAWMRTSRSDAPNMAFPSQAGGHTTVHLSTIFHLPSPAPKRAVGIPMTLQNCSCHHRLHSGSDCPRLKTPCRRRRPRLLDRYLKQFWPSLYPSDSPFLFVVRGGGPKSQTTLFQQITEAIRTHVGVRMTPHTATD